MVHLLRRAVGMAATATRGAVCFPRRVAELLRAGLDLRDRHAAGEISRHGLAVARGRLENQLSNLVFLPRAIREPLFLRKFAGLQRSDFSPAIRGQAEDASAVRVHSHDTLGRSSIRE